jgi:tRNA threonylcarbamoyl adenosine modification protein (Sua5/YciO/YrdC/YwlC family)
LEDGGLVAYPTDTYYAIGCDLFSKKAIERLYQLKNRDRKKPFALLCADLSNVARFAHVSNFAYRTMKKLTPGPFTFVLEATRLVPEMMMSKQKQVGIRVPDAVIAHALADALGHPLVTTSATHDESEPLLEGEPLVDARDIKASVGNRLELILDAGAQTLAASTVVSLIDDQLEVLRQGKGQIAL